MFFDQIEMGSESRFLHTGDPESMFGIGFLDKSGRRIDQEKFSTKHYTLVYILQGSVDYVNEDGVRNKLSAGDCFQRIPGKAHSTYIASKEYKECYVAISMKAFESCRETRALPLSTPCLRLGLSLGMTSRFARLRDELRQAAPWQLPSVALKCQLLIADFFAAAFRGNLKKYDGSGMIEKACEEMALARSERFDIQKFCRENGCSYVTFRRKFKNRVGLAPAQYRLIQRLDQAYALLCYGKVSVKEAANRLGFSSPFEFSARFKRHFGCAPSKAAQEIDPKQVKRTAGAHRRGCTLRAS